MNTKNENKIKENKKYKCLTEFFNCKVKLSTLKEKV